MLSVMYVKKITSFCQALENMHTKENWFLFSASRYRRGLCIPPRNTGTRKFDSGLSHIVHHDLHWLDVPQRVIFKLCMTVYKCLHSSAPKYLAELCVPVADVAGRRQLRSASRGLLNFPTTCQTMVDVRSISPVLTSGTHFLSISSNQHK